MIICGMSQSGKTDLARKILKTQAYDHEFKNVMWCYSMFQPWFLESNEINFVSGIPETYENIDLMVIDDLMNSITPLIAQLFTVGSHHHSISIILILQNLYPKSKLMRDISLNCHYFILFRNTRDVGQLLCFARQAFPKQSPFFLHAYKSSTEKPFSYLLVDCHPMTHEKFRLRENIFPDESGIYWIYQPK